MGMSDEVDDYLNAAMHGGGRGSLYSSTFQLNLSAFHEIGGARRSCVARVKGV